MSTSWGFGFFFTPPPSSKMTENAVTHPHKTSFQDFSSMIHIKMVLNDKNKLHFDIWVLLEGLGGFWPPPGPKMTKNAVFAPKKAVF